MRHLLLLLILPGFLSAYPRQENQNNKEYPGLKPLLFFIERVLDSQTAAQQHHGRLLQDTQQKQSLPPTHQQQLLQQKLEQENVQQKQQQKEEKALPLPEVSAKQQVLLPSLPYAGLSYYEPQFNFVQEKQPVLRIHPQILLYTPSTATGGPGQPILINPLAPPSNFLPAGPVGGGAGIQRPVFLAGYPRPAHVPAIEKDAEEIPTDPRRIPPFLGSTGPNVRKPEKLETFNEGKDAQTRSKSAGEADVLAEADKNPQLIPHSSLKPGHRFFILNGEPLFEDNIFQNYPDPNVKYGQTEQFQSEPLQKQPELNNVVLLRNIPGDYNQIPVGPQNFLFGEPVSNHQAVFRSNLPLEIGDDDLYQVGQFKFTPPGEPYFAINAEDIDNDSIVVDAKIEEGSNSGTSESQKTEKSEPSTAQAAPGAVAVAGPGGVAGASPRATALAGKGGLAVSSPQATAVAGPRDEDKNKKPTKKTGNK